MRRLALTLVVSALAAACSDLQQPTALPLEAPSAAMTASQLDDVIVVFRDNVADPRGLAEQLVNANGGSLGHVYTTALRGFSASLPPQAIQGIQNNPNVSFVEPDGVMTATTVQTGATWGIDRIDQPSGTDGSYAYDFDGTGVTVYVLDTGILTTHSDFGGRATHGPDFIDGDDISQDCNGHGTHVAGTVGSATYGVAKEVNLVAVRVLNCQGSGSYSGIIAAIDYVTGDETGLRVINMSLSGGASSSVNAAVNGSVANGVVNAVAAGNENTNACGSSPASAADALTAGSTTSSDARSSFSNFGTCVDLFAPGSGIRSTDVNGGSSVKSGTSMASPHVAGAAALYWDEFPNASASQVNAGITAAATQGAVSNAGTGSPNLLLYTLGFGDPPEPPEDVVVEIESHTVVASSSRNRKRGISSVRIVEVGGAGVGGVTVSGQWEDDYTGSGSGVTDANGDVQIQTPNIRGANTFTFCVNSLSGSGIVDQSGLNDCANSGGDPPPPPPPSGAPDNLSVAWKTKGKARADLSWTGGPATVDIRRDDAVIATISNNQSYRDNNPGTAYKVCSPGETSPEQCTDEVSRP